MYTGNSTEDFLIGIIILFGFKVQSNNIVSGMDFQYSISRHHIYWLDQSLHRDHRQSTTLVSQLNTQLFLQQTLRSQRWESSILHCHCFIKCYKEKVWYLLKMKKSLSPFWYLESEVQQCSWGAGRQWTINVIGLNFYSLICQFMM